MSNPSNRDDLGGQGSMGSGDLDRNIDRDKDRNREKDPNRDRDLNRDKNINRDNPNSGFGGQFEEDDEMGGGSNKGGSPNR